MSLEVSDGRLLQLQRALALISGSIIATISIYGLVAALREYTSEGIVTIGVWLVEFDFPLPFIAKPITYLSIAIVIFFYSLFELKKRRIANFSKSTRTFLSLLALLIAFASAYEVLYNFTIWNALITADAMRGIIVIDMQNIPYPNPKIPWNLPFATKLFSAFFVVSLYFLFLLQKLELKRG